MANSDGRFIIGIGAITENTETGKILLLLRSSYVDFAKYQWDCLGGRMNQFETPEETLFREVKEETGIAQISIVKPLEVSHYFRGEEKAENEMIVLNYWCKTPIEKVTLSTEHDEYKWVYPEEALTLVEDIHLKKTIQIYIREKGIHNHS